MLKPKCLCFNKHFGFVCVWDYIKNSFMLDIQDSFDSENEFCILQFMMF